MRKDDKTAELIDAAGYFRMSTDDQKTSIQQQETEVAVLEERGGYRIVERYYEEGKSGSRNQDERTEFKRMLLDAAMGKFKVILCYDSSRFARLDSIDGAMAKQLLRKNGVRLETVKEGKFDWTTFVGRLQDVILSEANHKYSRDLSRESLRGRMDLLHHKQWPHGSVPYGYDRVYSDGTHSQHVARNEKFQKGRNWRLTLVENAIEAPFVKGLFTQYAREDTSMRQLAGDLTARGIPSPSGKQGWSKAAVKDILVNRAYIGYGRIGLGRSSQKDAFNRAPPTEVAGCCPALVDIDTFAIVQAKLEDMKLSGRRPQRYRSSILSGVVVCGRCGYRMQKKTRKNGVSYFTCSSAMHRPGLGCHQWRVHEGEILPQIMRLLTDAYERDVLVKLRVAPVSKELEDKEKAALESAREALKARIEKGSARYLTAPDSLRVSLGKTLQRWQEDLKVVEEKLVQAQLASADERASLEKWLDQIGKDLMVLVQASEPSTITVRAIELPKAVLAAARQRYPSSVIHCRMTWDAAGKVEFDKGPMYEIQPSGPAWIIEETGDFDYGIITNRSALRQFLLNTKARVTLYWKPRGKRYFELDWGRLEADFADLRTAKKCSSGKTAEPARVKYRIDRDLEGASGAPGGVRNNRNSRARSRDTG
jgi:site-specific DNA recombinase